MSFDFTDLRRTLRESAYTLTAFPIGLASFVAVLVLVTVGIGTAVIVGGILLLVGGVWLARAVRAARAPPAALDARPGRGHAGVRRARDRTPESSVARSPRSATRSPGSTWCGAWSRS